MLFLLCTVAIVVVLVVYMFFGFQAAASALLIMLLLAWAYYTRRKKGDALRVLSSKIGESAHNADSAYAHLAGLDHDFADAVIRKAPPDSVRVTRLSVYRLQRDVRQIRTRIQNVWLLEPRDLTLFDGDKYVAVGDLVEAWAAWIKAYGSSRTRGRKRSPHLVNA